MQSKVILLSMFVNLNPKKVVINYEGIIKNGFCGKKLKTSEETNEYFTK